MITIKNKHEKYVYDTKFDLNTIFVYKLGKMARVCVSCGKDQNETEYEGNRKKCKECRKNEAHNRLRDRAIAQKNMETQECSECHEIKKINEFRPSFLRCRECVTNYFTNRKNTDIHAFLSTLCYTAKHSAFRRLAKSREEAGKYEINTDYLLELMKQQNGLCYYSSIPLVFKQYSHWKCSLERIDTNKGYINGNVKLIAGEFQSASQWTIEKYKVFIELINIKHKHFQIIWKSSKDPKKPEKMESFENEGKILYRCTHCHKVKESNQFNVKFNTGCKECIAKAQKDHLATPHGHLTKLLADMRTRSRRKWQSEPELTVEIMHNIIDEQGGLCSYSGIPMTYGSYLDKWWTCSPERKDVDSGYTKENVCFICYEFNTSVILNKAIPESTESSGWSKAKIQYIKNNIK